MNQTVPLRTQVVDMTTGAVTSEHVTQAQLLPAPAGTCAECARAHPAEQPHDATRLHYQYAFYGREGRWPDWRDAWAHCTPEVQKHWRDHLVSMGVDVDAGKVRPGRAG